MKLHGVYISCIAALLLMGCSASQKNIAVTATPVDIALQTLLQSTPIANATIGVLVQDASSGRVISSHNATQYFVPASNTKLWTMYTGLKYLKDSLVGIQYYKTADTLYLKPTADPTLLQSEYTTHNVSKLLANNNLPIVLLASNWQSKQFGAGWSWNDYESLYMAEKSAMPIRGNVVNLHFTTGQAVDTITGKPYIYYNTEANPVGSVPTQNITYLYDAGVESTELSRAQNANTYTITIGNNPKDTIFEIPAVTNGLQFTADNIGANTSVSYNIVNPLWQFSTIHSQPTDSMLKPLMHRSDNFYAEQTLLMVSQQLLGIMDERKLIDTLLKTDFKDLPQKPRWVDGSGLSRYNLFTPADYVWLLQKMKTEFGAARVEGILATGNQGTLSKYYMPLQGKIFAKTGTLGGVVALSGYLQAASGKQLLFSVLVNNHNGSAVAVRRAVEAYLLQVYEHE